ncbi:uncharacterized protein LAJ45_05193 [Morchella importuna]|uniref:uncharacterized protein n=1 Tax=Morchella importuna TaxID=1174673 RepID=UPI001E8EA6E4|nr:uncharacterized protein LAJ45_05193 [Morchella importuna]KAH8150498.1 hypothetical protein LAJ45_05193 [Morchella importuna]
MPTKPVEKSQYDTRRDIIALPNHGLPVSEIVKETGASESTVYRAVAKYKKEGHVCYLPRSGRPSILSKAEI